MAMTARCRTPRDRIETTISVSVINYNKDLNKQLTEMISGLI